MPKVSYTLKSSFDQITDIGDRIKVTHESLYLSLTTSIITYNYDCILKKYKGLSFGNFQKTLADLLSDIKNTTSQAITEQTNQLQTEFTDEINASTGEIWQLLDGSFVAY